MMKMVMVTYNEAVDVEVMEEVEKCGIKNYTKILAAYGKGETSGTHLGNDIWPGKNNMLYITCEDAKAKQLISRIRELRKSLGAEGVKAFVLPVEEMT